MSDNNSTEVKKSPGQRLQQARVAKGWSAEKLADKMNLSCQRVTELEVDDYHLMGGAAYIRGYLRTYARLVGVSAQEIMADFETLGFVEDQKQSNPVLQPEVERQKAPTNLRWVWWVSLSVMILLVVLVGIWASHNATDDTTSSSSVINTITPPQQQNVNTMNNNTTNNHEINSTASVVNQQ